MITGIAGLVLRVSDLERSLGFYRDGLGLECDSDPADCVGGVRLKVGRDAHLDLLGGARRREKACDFERIGYHHFCLAVGDIQHLADRLYVKGLIKVPTLTHNKDLNDGLWLEDPDGNAVEIVQYMPESPLMKAGGRLYGLGRVGVTGIGHVSFVVENMERSLRYYTDVLGFERALDLNDDEGEPFLIFLRVADGAFIELFYTGKRKESEDPGAAGFVCAVFRRDGMQETFPFFLQDDMKIDAPWIVDPDSNRFKLAPPI